MHIILGLVYIYSRTSVSNVVTQLYIQPYQINMKLPSGLQFTLIWSIVAYYKQNILSCSGNLDPEGYACMCIHIQTPVHVKDAH